jgi:hypothetical protein
LHVWRSPDAKVAPTKRPDLIFAASNARLAVVAAVAVVVAAAAVVAKSH